MPPQSEEANDSEIGDVDEGEDEDEEEEEAEVTCVAMMCSLF